MKVLFIHGFGTNADEMTWMQNSKKLLEEKGHDVRMPSFPNSSNPKFGEWLAEFEEAIKDWCNPHELTIIGHSLGASFAMMLTGKYKFKSLIAVAPGYVGHISREEYYERSSRSVEQKEIMYSFFEDGGKIDPKLVRANCSELILFYSDDDKNIKDYTKEFFVNEIDFDKYYELTGYGHFMTKGENPIDSFKELDSILYIRKE